MTDHSRGPASTPAYARPPSGASTPINSAPPPLRPDPTQAQARHPPPNTIVTRDTLAGVVSTAPYTSLFRYPSVFTLVKAGENTTPQAQLE